MGWGRTGMRKCRKVVNAIMLVTIAAAASLPGLGAEGDPLHGAYDRYYNLEYDAAEKDLQNWLTTHPEDLRALS